MPTPRHIVDRIDGALQAMLQAAPRSQTAPTQLPPRITGPFWLNQWAPAHPDAFELWLLATSELRDVLQRQIAIKQARLEVAAEGGDPKVVWIVRANNYGEKRFAIRTGAPLSVLWKDAKCPPVGTEVGHWTTPAPEESKAAIRQRLEAQGVTLNLLPPHLLTTEELQARDLRATAHSSYGSLLTPEELASTLHVAAGGPPRELLEFDEFFAAWVPRAELLARMRWRPGPLTPDEQHFAQHVPWSWMGATNPAELKLTLLEAAATSRQTAGSKHMCPACGHETGHPTPGQQMDEEVSLGEMILHLRNATQTEAETIPPGIRRRPPSISVWIQWNGQWKAQNRPRPAPSCEGPPTPWTQELTPADTGAAPASLTDSTSTPVGAVTVESSLLATRNNRSR
ncbi:MAG: hypothetical protein VX938_03320, partial [Myxococcota bacterium]|nr:hypothetical protein [Myxococcota bacterium]